MTIQPISAGFVLALIVTVVAIILLIIGHLPLVTGLLIIGLGPARLF